MIYLLLTIVLGGAITGWMWWAAGAPCRDTSGAGTAVTHVCPSTTVDKVVM